MQSQWLCRHSLDCNCVCWLLVTGQNTRYSDYWCVFLFSIYGSKIKMVCFCAQSQTSVSDCVDMIIISFMLTLLQYWSCHSFQWSGLWFKLVKVKSALMMITAEHHLLSMKYSNFFYYICYLLPQHGSPLILPFCSSQTVFYPTSILGHLSYEPEGVQTCYGNELVEDNWRDVSCPHLLKQNCVITRAIQPSTSPAICAVSSTDP